MPEWPIHGLLQPPSSGKHHIQLVKASDKASANVFDSLCSCFLRKVKLTGALGALVTGIVAVSTSQDISRSSELQQLYMAMDYVCFMQINEYLSKVVDSKQMDEWEQMDQLLKEWYASQLLLDSGIEQPILLWLSPPPLCAKKLVAALQEFGLVSKAPYEARGFWISAAIFDHQGQGDDI